MFLRGASRKAKLLKLNELFGGVRKNRGAPKNEGISHDVYENKQ